MQKRLRSLEKNTREDRRCELWILFEDGRVQQLGSDEIFWQRELPEPDPCVTRFFISSADARACSPITCRRVLPWGGVGDDFAVTIDIGHSVAATRKVKIGEPTIRPTTDSGTLEPVSTLAANLKLAHSWG